MNVPYRPRHAQIVANKQGTRLLFRDIDIGFSDYVGRNTFFGRFEIYSVTGSKPDHGLSYDPYKGET